VCPAEHIQKQLERGYAVKDVASQAFDPTALGESLISSYRRMGLDNLWKPDLRGRIEQGISRIAAGQVGGVAMVHRLLLRCQVLRNISVVVLPSRRY
jgi:DNA topoisomerase IA